MDVTIMKTQFFIKLLTEMSLYVIEKFCAFFTLRPFDLIDLHLTSVLMDNFCNHFKYDLSTQESLLNNSKVLEIQIFSFGLY